MCVFQFLYLCLQMWQFAPNSVHYLLSLWQRMVASVPYVKATEPHLLETYTPEVSNAYITSRLESVAVVVRYLHVTFKNIVPCWRYLLGIYRLSHSILHTFFIPDFTAGIAIALLQPVLTLMALTMALLCRFSDCKLKNCRTLDAFPLWRPANHSLITDY
jgi:hypothetical protein